MRQWAFNQAELKTTKSQPHQCGIDTMPRGSLVSNARVEASTSVRGPRAITTTTSGCRLTSEGI